MTMGTSSEPILIAIGQKMHGESLSNLCRTNCANHDMLYLTLRFREGFLNTGQTTAI